MISQSGLITIIIDGVEIAFKEAGRGSPVIFLHGGGATDYRTWDAQLDLFSKGYHVFAYSRRGHYPNAHAPDNSLPNSTETHGRDLFNLIKALNLGRVSLVATSYGGDIALWMAVHAPEQINSLALCEPALHPWLVTLPGGLELYAQYRVPMDAAAKAVQAGDLNQAARLFIEASSGPGAFDRLSDSARSRLMDNIHLLRSWQVDAFDTTTTITREEAAKIKLPMQLVSGRQSPDIYRRVTEELKRIISQAQWSVIPDSAHLPHIQNPVTFHRVVADFLAATTKLPLEPESNGAPVISP